MTSQLRDIAADYQSASARLERLVERGAPAAWRARPKPGAWSALECLDHLNRTSEQFLPIVRTALAEAPRLEGKLAGRRYRRDPVGWLLWAIMPPPVRLAKSRTTAAFEPARELELTPLVERFAVLQREQLECVEGAAGRALDRVYVVSPFNARVRYNLFACLGILPRHQHRHLWQAEQAIAAASMGRS